MPITKRSVVVNTHRTSISLEDQFWLALRMIADKRKTSIQKLVSAIDNNKKIDNLSSACRLFILECALDRTI